MNKIIKISILRLTLISTLFTVGIVNNQVRLSAQTAVTCGQELTVMPIGDSLTEGYANALNNGNFIKGYRPELWNKLNNMNFKKVDFVGTKIGFYNSPNIVPYFDDDHESWSGTRSDVIRDKIRASQSVSQLKPSVITLLSGTNDVVQSVPTAQALSNFKSLIQEVSAQSPYSRIIVSAILPMRGSYSIHNPAVIRYNTAIINYINSISISNPITIFDNSFINPANDLISDGAHASASGDEKLAAKFAQEFSKIEFNSFRKCPSLTAPTSESVAYPNFSKVKKNDFNNDGKSDIIWRNKATGDNLVWYMNGKDPMSHAFLPKAPDLNWQIVSIVDYDRDGKPDIIWRNKATGSNVVWYMDGKNFKSGATTSTTVTPSDWAILPSTPDLNWDIVGSADFNDDGKPDLVFRNKITGDNVVWYMDGKNFKSGTQIRIPSDYTSLPNANNIWEIVDINDYDYDGKPDIFFRNKVAGSNVVWYMDGKNFKSGTQTATPSDWAISFPVVDLNWEIVGSGDFNYDNKPDIIWRNKFTGENIIWYMNGKDPLSLVYTLKIPDLNWQIRNK